MTKDIALRRLGHPESTHTRCPLCGPLPKLVIKRGMPAGICSICWTKWSCYIGLIAEEEKYWDLWINTATDKSNSNETFWSVENDYEGGDTRTQG